MTVFEELNGVGSECRSYLVADSGEALIVDPVLERADDYLRRLGALRLRLAYAADTHTHADHLSASKELSRKTGAKTAGAPAAVVQVPLGEGSALRVGKLTVAVWASPSIGEERRTNGRILIGREKFVAAMRESRPSKPARMAEALAYNTAPLS